MNHSIIDDIKDWISCPDVWRAVKRVCPHDRHSILSQRFPQSWVVFFMNRHDLTLLSGWTSCVNFFRSALWQRRERLIVEHNRGALNFANEMRSRSPTLTRSTSDDDPSSSRDREQEL